jgi:hypothetical protein
MESRSFADVSPRRQSRRGNSVTPPRDFAIVAAGR